jgi:anti-sigma regulatory factor (Ser/Thr protein kinase)
VGLGRRLAPSSSALGAVMDASPTGSAFSHQVVFHGSDDELLQVVVPFCAAGAGSDQQVLVCCRPPTTQLLQRALGPGHQVTYLDYEATYSTPIAAIAAYQELIDGYLSAGADSVRVVAEAVYDRTADERAEWSRYEAVANHAMQAYPVSAVCLYDTRRVPEDLLTLARRTHPAVLTMTGDGTNPEYMDPALFLRETNQAAPEPLETEPPDLEISKVADLDELRLQLELCLFQTTHMAREAADLVLAANEVATNALRYGRPPVRLRLWVRADRCLCTITDRGPGIHDPFAGYIWPGALSHPPTHGMGLWLARRLCDRVDIVDGPDTCTVRLVIQRRHTTAALSA